MRPCPCIWAIGGKIDEELIDNKIWERPNQNIHLGVEGIGFARDDALQANDRDRSGQDRVDGAVWVPSPAPFSADHRLEEAAAGEEGAGPGTYHRGRKGVGYMNGEYGLYVFQCAVIYHAPRPYAGLLRRLEEQDHRSLHVYTHVWVYIYMYILYLSSRNLNKQRATSDLQLICGGDDRSEARTCRRCSRALSNLAAPSSMATWASWPHACILPGTLLLCSHSTISCSHPNSQIFIIF